MSCFEKYKSVSKIAEGGFSEVYLAASPDDNRPVAVKTLKKEHLPDQKLRQIFEVEIEFLRKVRHPQIPSYLDSCMQEEECSIVMDHIPGHSLAFLIDQRRESGAFFPPEFIFGIFDQVCSLLHYLHTFEDENGKNAIIHGDIKPKNIMITPEKKAFLIDFSVAMHHDPNRKMTGGTYRYMSAEMYAGYAPSSQSDLFGAMLTLYEMFFLQPLIRQNNPAAMFSYLLSGEHIQKIQKMRLRKPLEEMLLKGLSLDPQKRFSSAGEMAAAAREISYTVPPSS